MPIGCDVETTPQILQYYTPTTDDAGVLSSKKTTLDSTAWLDASRSRAFCLLSEHEARETRKKRGGAHSDPHGGEPHRVSGSRLNPIGCVARSATRCLRSDLSTTNSRGERLRAPREDDRGIRYVESLGTRRGRGSRGVRFSQEDHDAQVRDRRAAQKRAKKKAKAKRASKREELYTGSRACSCRGSRP
eukprot:30679-Pelagococcus_subviridis.AAC.2